LSFSQNWYLFSRFPHPFMGWFGIVSLAFVFVLGGLAPSQLHAQMVTTTISAGSGAVAVAANPVTNKIYVANCGLPCSDTSGGNGNITVIDGATNMPTTITAGTNPKAVAVNPVTNKIYVANWGSSNVTVIDGASNATTTVSAETYPNAVVVNPVTNKIYVANYGSASVTVIDGATNSPTSVNVEINPSGLAVNPVTNKIYVANYGSASVTVIDGATNSPTRVNVGTNPSGVAVNPVTNKIYVANRGSDNVTVIDGASNSPTMVSTGNGSYPWVVAVNPVTNRIYVANWGNKGVTVIDGSNNTISTVSVGNTPAAVAVNSMTNQIYVANQGDGNVTVIDGATNATTAVSVGHVPTGVAVNPVTNKIYVANTDDGNVTVIDGATNTTTTVDVGTNPQGVAVNPVTNQIYVANAGSASVTVIDGATNTTTTVNVGSGPAAIAVNPVTNQIYVANYASASVTVIDGATNATTTVNVGSGPAAIAVNPVTNKIYVANEGSNNVTVIDGATNSTATVSTGTYPWAVAVNPVTNKVYVVSYVSNTVTVIDGATNATTAVSVGGEPYAVAVNPVTNKVYVANYASESVSVIDGVTNATTTVSVGGGSYPWALAVNPVTNKIYVANYDSNTSTVIDGLTNTTTTVSTGGSPYGVAVNPVTNKIYVANESSNTITVIDGATNTPATVSTGTYPWAVAVNPVTNKIYVTNHIDNTVTAIDEQLAQPIPLQANITPLADNVSRGLTPAFNFMASSTFLPFAASPDNLLFQVDTWQGPWTAATAEGNGAYDGTTAALQPGLHILYAYATDGQDATTQGSTARGTSPLISDIAGYGFLVAPPVATLTPASLSFGNQPIGIASTAQTVTLAASVATLGIASIAITGPNNNDFSEANICETSLFAGEACSIKVVFTPSAQGAESATLTVTDDSGGVSGSTQTVSLTGTGTQQSQTISFPNPGTQTYGVAPFALTATASSGLPVSYTVVSSPATVSGSTLTITGVGSVTVQATQAGNNAWLAATPVSVTFTVNPAVLTVTANNMAMSFVAQVAPTFTASYSGFVKGDTSTVLTGAPAFSTVTLPLSAGSYPIGVSQGTLSAANYTFTFVPGTLAITPAATPTLTFLNNYFVTGDHIVRSFDQGSGNISNGFVNGTITIPSSSPGQEGVPAGADIVAAFLYWQALETTSAPSSASALFNRYSITGSQVGSDLQSSCWSVNGSTPFMRTYRANVLPYLPVINGASQAVYSHTVAVPANTYGTVPGNASLVIVYRVLSNQPSQYRLKATVIYDGNWSLEYAAGNPSYFNETISGFYDADASGSAKITDIFGTVVNNGGVGFSPATSTGYTWPQTLTPDASGIIMPNHYALQSGQCNVWAAVVFSTAVKNSDGDGLLDAWKTGPTQSGDPHFENPGYYDVRDNSWVDLTGAQHGRKDLFVQLDYMVETPSLYPSQNALNMVQNAFVNNNHDIYVHFVQGNAITEDTCTDDTTSSPPSLCMFPKEPGVVAWKTGLEVMKAWPVPPAGKDLTSCIYPAICPSRFPIARKDSYHYVLFGHSIALPTWSILTNTLASIQVTSGVPTVTVSAPINSCPTRVTIDGALAAPNLNGVYPVTSCVSGATTFVLSPVNANANVKDGIYSGTSTPPEPQLAIYRSTTEIWSTVSIQVSPPPASAPAGSGTATVTTSSPFPNMNSCPALVTVDSAPATSNLNGVYSVTSCPTATTFTFLTVNVSDGIYSNLEVYEDTTDTTSGFSDLGGGDSTVTLGKWKPPQTQSEQDYEQAGTLMHELGHSLGLTHGGRYYPNGSTTPGFEPNCKPNYQSVMSYLFQVDGIRTDAQDDLVLDYSDRALDSLYESSRSVPGLTGPEGLRYGYTKWFSPTPTSSSLQVGQPQAALCHCDGTPISSTDFDQTMYETEGPASQLTWPSTQDINFDGSISVLDGYSDWDNIDLRQIGASGNDNISGMIYLIDGEYRLPLGADLFGGGGGIKASGGGGGIKASGGGGGIKASGGGGGIKASGGGGGIKASGGGGGIKASGGGGGMSEADYPKIDSYARPPRAVTELGGVISWLPPTFGNIVKFNVYSNVNGSVSLLTSIPYDPNATNYTFTDTSWKQGSNVTYYVTTVDLDPTNSPRESTPSLAMLDQTALTLNPQNPPLAYNSSETLWTSGGSTGGAVTYNLVSGPCTLSGAVLTANSGTGSCSVTATMAGSSTYYPVTSAPFTVTLKKATASVTPAAASKIYGAPDPALTGTLTGFVPADDVTATYTRVAGVTVAGSPYTISATLSPATVLGNYSITYNTAAFTISQASTATALTATPNPADFGQSVLLKATVAPVAPGAGTPTGAVTFKDGSTSLTTVAMSNAAAMFTISSLAAGTHNLTASYSGDANFSVSASALTEQVMCGVLLSISPSTMHLGGTVTVTGQVISCATTAQTVVVKFSLSGPLQPNKCSSMKSDIFTTPPFTLPAKTSKRVSFPFPISRGACTGNYSITATTLVNGTVINTSKALLAITAH
jgi:YVTN family beta-propeller protein